MNILFYGAGKFGKLALDKFKQWDEKEIILNGFMDSNKVGTYLQYPIIPIEKLQDTDAVVITIANPYIAIQIYYILRQKGVNYIYWFMNVEVKNRRNFLSDTCTDMSKYGNYVLPQVEMHVADYCNLNCKGCTHFSPIFDKKFPDFKSRISDVKNLKEKFPYILQFSILGGEPFLNTQITMYITEIRKLLPDTYIQIVTNGLLIPKLENEIFECIRKNKIVVSVSEYAPTHKIIENIERKLNEFGVTYVIRDYDSKQRFNKPLSINENSQYPHQCISNGCVNIWDGKIARCPTLMYIERFNEVFKTRLPSEGIMNLCDCPGGKELLEILKQEVPLCRYCVRNEMEWGQCGKNPMIEDFADYR